MVSTQKYRSLVTPTLITEESPEITRSPNPNPNPSSTNPQLRTLTLIGRIQGRYGAQSTTDDRHRAVFRSYSSSEHKRRSCSTQLPLHRVPNSTGSVGVSVCLRKSSGATNDTSLCLPSPCRGSTASTAAAAVEGIFNVEALAVHRSP